MVPADNRTRSNHRAIRASSTGLRYSFAVRTVSDWNQLPAVVVEQENPAAFKAQLARCAPVRMPWPTTTISVILHEDEEVCWLLCKTRQDRASRKSKQPAWCTNRVAQSVDRQFADRRRSQSMLHTLKGIGQFVVHIRITYLWDY